MKAFVAALSLLAAGASAEADPQFLVGSPLVHTLAYNTPVVYKTAEKVEKTEEEAEVKEFKPVVYTNQLYPQAYQTPYYYAPKVELKKAEEVEGKPIVYTHTPLTYAYQQPLVHQYPVVYKAAEPMPKYVAKNGEVEHKVFKRDAEADAEAMVYYNTHGVWPVGYVAPSTYAAATYTTPVAYAHAPLTTSYKYVAPAATYTYAQAPIVAPAPVVYKTVEPVPKYVAKNGEVEHTVYKRDAEADAEAMVYYNTYGSWPVGYVAPATYAAPAPVTYASAPLATSYKYVAPATTAYTYAHAPYASQYFGQYYL